MGVTLATTWNPRGEMGRFENLLPQLEAVYDHIVISFPPVSDLQVVGEFQTGRFAGRNNLVIAVNQEWSWGRYIALQKALTTPAAYIQYADMDRLLRWVETRPEEWRQTVSVIQQCDCLVIGRTQAAYATHPQALRQTEAISNRVISHLLGQPMDVSAGSKGFSRGAAQFLIDKTSPGHALGTDAEWPLLLKRAGFRVDYHVVDGLDWESADRFQEQAADEQAQQTAAAAYDANPNHWAWRVAVAMEIVETGLETVEREIGEAS